MCFGNWDRTDRRLVFWSAKQIGRNWEKAIRDSFRSTCSLGVKKFRHQAAFELLVPASCLEPWLPVF